MQKCNGKKSFSVVQIKILCFPEKFSRRKCSRHGNAYLRTSGKRKNIKVSSAYNHVSIYVHNGEVIYIIISYELSRHHHNASQSSERVAVTPISTNQPRLFINLHSIFRSGFSLPIVVSITQSFTKRSNSGLSFELSKLGCLCFNPSPYQIEIANFSFDLFLIVLVTIKFYFRSTRYAWQLREEKFPIFNRKL